MDKRRYGTFGNEIVFHFEEGTMISVDQAWQFVVENFSSLMVEEVSLDNSLERVLAEDILADRDGPPFNRVAMDGIAVLSKNLEFKRSFFIESMAKAGEPQKKLIDNENAIEVMTGAPLPLGCDTVIRYEDLKIENGIALVDQSVAPIVANVHFQGSDFRKNEIIVSKNILIHAPLIGILASSGKSKVKVIRHPRIAIVSTGDELVEIDALPLDHQIRRSNLYALSAMLKSFGLNSVELIHLPDLPRVISARLESLITNVDVLILSGGVSEGKFDFIPQTLGDLGVRMIFHKVAQRPGKPLWFGKKDEKMVFALPGNPVSCLVCLRRYFIEAAYQMINAKVLSKEVILKNETKVKGERVFFQPVKINNIEGTLIATPILGNGSGDYLTLRDSDGFIELDPKNSPFEHSQIVKFYSWRNL
jgi:molybdopterin molybdotransferase